MLDERIIEKLSAYADGELDAQAAGEVARALTQDAALRACLEQFRRLDGVAAALPVPKMSNAAGAAVWKAVRARTVEGTAKELTPANLRRVEAALDEPPVISEERWRQAWTNVRAQTTDARLRPVDADLTPGPMHAVETAAPAQARRSAAPIPLWRSLTALAAAAVLLILATLAFMQHDPGRRDRPVPPKEQVATAPPQALDQRYFVMVQHVPGIEQPVVCFFLKEPDPELEEIATWQ
jgi:hypothetical protein